VRDDERGAPAGELAPIDHAGLARSLGAAAFTATTPAELADALAAARAEPGPALIECPVEPRRMALGSGAWWDLGVAHEAESPRTRELATAHAAGVSAQRFHG
jgi:3D-(3,5/4)-trihydroxycyclohexane-1,2-dione acylhydrolase (decyclizing)